MKTIFEKSGYTVEVNSYGKYFLSDGCQSLGRASTEKAAIKKIKAALSAVGKL